MNVCYRALNFSDPVFRRTHMPFESSHRPLARNGLVLAGLSALLVLAGCSNDDQAAQQGGGGMPPAAVLVADAALTDASDRKGYASRGRGAKEVEDRARITGLLEQQLYDAGQKVSEG